MLAIILHMESVYFYLSTRSLPSECRALAQGKENQSAQLSLDLDT